MEEVVSPFSSNQRRHQPPIQVCLSALQRAAEQNRTDTAESAHLSIAPPPVGGAVGGRRRRRWWEVGVREALQRRAPGGSHWIIEGAIGKGRRPIGTPPSSTNQASACLLRLVFPSSVFSAGDGRILKATIRPQRNSRLADCNQRCGAEVEGGEGTGRAGRGFKFGMTPPHPTYHAYP